MKTCFMFGHSSADYHALPKIAEAAERHYLDYGIRRFVVGNRGAFDHIATTAIKTLQKKYNDISLQLLLAYHPAERPFQLSEGFDGSYYPPLEKVPRQFAIVRANRYMIENAHSIICFVSGIGNSRNLFNYAQRRRDVPIENVADPLNASAAAGKRDPASNKK